MSDENQEQEQPQDAEQSAGEFVDIPDAPAPPTIEERFAALKAKATEIGCDLRISIVVGGVKRDEVYRIWETTGEDATFAEDLDSVETQLGDVRMLAAAEATSRMVDAERLAEAIDLLAAQRQAEYRIAASALRQAYEHGNTPADGDNIQELAGLAATVERDRQPSESLAEILAKGYPPKAENKEAQS